MQEGALPNRSIILLVKPPAHLRFCFLSRRGGGATRSIGQNSILEPRQFRSGSAAKSIERYTFAKTSWAWKGDNGTITKLILPWHISMRLFEMKSTLAFCLDDHY
ncbi:hypothetical protein EJB05_30645, partial [Eragrostis curvula]